MLAAFGAAMPLEQQCSRLHVFTARGGAVDQPWVPLAIPRHTQAAQLFARAGEAERAARLFLACREFALLDGVMEHAGSPALWLQYAQAKEGGRGRDWGEEGQRRSAWLEC